MKTFAVDALPGLVEQIKSGEAVALTLGNKVLGKVVLAEGIAKWDDFGEPLNFETIKGVERKPGTLKGIWMAPDFDAPLEEFGEIVD